MDRIELSFGPRALELGPRVLERSSGRVILATRTAGGAASSERREEFELEQLHAACAADEDAAILWQACENHALRAAPAQVMGIVNVTPDSFSDGGQYLDPELAIDHGMRLVRDGAQLLDVGGESTRPGAVPVSAAEELERVAPVVQGLAARRSSAAASFELSIDTTKAEVAAAALDAGATLVNDVSAGRADEDLLPLVADRGARIVLMHMQGEPRSMQRAPHYADVVADVCAFLRERVAACLAAGIDAASIVVDPGIGFGKTLDHNLALLARLHELRSLGLPLLLGVSRKSFMAHLARRQGVADSLETSGRAGGSAAAVALGVAAGAKILRVHDVALMAETVRVAEAIAGSPPQGSAS